MNGTVSERRKHHFSVSPNFDINTFDWVEFCSHLQEEIRKHAEDQHRREATNVQEAGIN